jgi:putative redox protein
MNIVKANVNFENSFKGELIVDSGRVPIGINQGEVLPYDMLFGALGSCVYATFLDIMAKKRIEFESASISIQGEKKTDIPTTLKWVKTTMTVVGCDDQVKVRRSFELATKYCSIYQTISKVAQMTWEVSFE